jgi:1-acyl-sn-glycerol-3-phosphate acyltransferase
VSAEALAWNPLWHAVGLGTTPYARLAFRIETHDPEGFRMEPGSLIVVTHRTENDVPVVIEEVYGRSRAWADRSQRLHFAARDDLFERGFFAGFPQRLPGWARRLVYPVAIERYLPMVRVHPIGSANRMKLAQALGRVDPRTPLPEEVGLPVRTAGAALSGRFAKELWRDVTPADFPVEEAWTRRAAEARKQLETLIELLRDREPLVLFPEGRPSPDGAIGPVQRGLSLLVRRGQPETLRPWGLGWDPLVRGRRRVVVSLRPPVEPDRENVEAQVLGELKLAVPLTAGSLVAHSLLGGDDPAAALPGAVQEALGEGRHVQREIGSRVEEALSVVKGLSDPRLARLAREYESARGLT